MKKKNSKDIEYGAMNNANWNIKIGSENKRIQE